LIQLITSDDFSLTLQTIPLLPFRTPLLLKIIQMEIQTILANFIIPRITFGMIHGKIYLSIKLKIIRLLMQAAPV